MLEVPVWFSVGRLLVRCSFAHSCLRVVLVYCNHALCGVCEAPELTPVTLKITLCKELVFFIEVR